MADKADSTDKLETNLAQADIESMPVSKEEETKAAQLVRETARALKEDDRAALTSIVDNNHEADLAGLIQLLNHEQREKFITAIGDNLDPAVLVELDDAVSAEVSEALKVDTLVSAVQELETDDAVFVLGELEEDDQQKILDRIPETERIVLQRSLDYPDDSAGRLMRSDLVAVPPFWTVGQMIDYLRETDELPDDFLEIFVVDPSHTPMGVVRLNRAMRSARPTKLSEIMDEHLSLIPAHMDREDMARQFARYNLVSAPVVDEDNRLLGVITADDVFEVIVEEAEEDILALGGVGHEALTDNMFEAAGGRFTWLFVNLLTAIFASAVIALFDASIEQMVALAILMPIVASMGGNAATQTLTITVRALATLELMPVNALRVVAREIGIGLLNGVLFAVLIGCVGALWFDNVWLGIVLALAMLVNMLVAGLSGILIPIGLSKAGIDPAVASGVFVTTVTDVIGFLAFLGFGTWILL